VRLLRKQLIDHGGKAKLLGIGIRNGGQDEKDTGTASGGEKTPRRRSWGEREGLRNREA